MARATSLSILDFFGHLVGLTDLSAELQADLTTNQAFIPLDITAVREIATNAIQNLAASGGIMAADSTPILTRVNGATDNALRLEWVDADVAEVQFPPIPLPPDLDPDEDVVLHLLLSRSGTATDCHVTVNFFETTVTGAAYAADTKVAVITDALTGAATVINEVTAVLGSSDVVGPPGVLNISLVPDTHSTDHLFLWGAYIEYSRKLRTT